MSHGSLSGPRRRPDLAGPLPALAGPDKAAAPSLELCTVSRTPMPTGVRGAVVTAVDETPGGTLRVGWVPTGEYRIPAGRIVLSWRSAADGGMAVTAHLRLARTEVLLASWPQLGGEWSDVVRPTATQVTELHAALRLAASILEDMADRV